MRHILKIIIILLIFISSVELLKGQGNSLSFLTVSPDARSSSLGESGGALMDGANSIYWNPSAIAFNRNLDIMFCHSNWFSNLPDIDFLFEYLAYKQYFDWLKGSVSSSITYLNYGEFIRTGPDSYEPIGTFHPFELAFTLGYGAKLGSDWALGLNTRIIYSKLADKPQEGVGGSASTTAFSFDIGAMWRPSKYYIPLLGIFTNRMSVGVSINNIGPHISYATNSIKDPLPTTFRLSFAKKVLALDKHSLTATLDFTKILAQRVDSTESRDNFLASILTSWGDQSFSEELRDITTAFGLEYWCELTDDFRFAIRTGFHYEDPSYGNRQYFAFGAGLIYKIYNFDFGYITTAPNKYSATHPFNNTLKFTLSINIGGMGNIKEIEHGD
ncbi:MAG: PorV/PorQ family protein [Ignavibacteriales bacterium]|nr:PorV/PorQ family protein [Ignavibacteriales bacterium]